MKLLAALAFYLYIFSVGSRAVSLTGQVDDVLTLFDTDFEAIRLAEQQSEQDALVSSSLSFLETSSTASDTNHRVSAMYAETHCLGWRNTGLCTPEGPREPQYDDTCKKTIPNGRSGYCLCAGGVRGGDVGCVHKEFNCHDVCEKQQQFRRSWHVAPKTPLGPKSVPFCIGWRNTGGCNPNGPREERYDATCSTEIPELRSGYCLCAGGARAGESDCRKRKPIVCAQVCKNVPMPTLPAGTVELPTKAFSKFNQTDAMKFAKLTPLQQSDLANQHLVSMKGELLHAGNVVEQMRKDLHHPYTDKKVNDLKKRVAGVLTDVMKKTGVPGGFQAGIQKAWAQALEVQLGLKKAPKNK